MDQASLKLVKMQYREAQVLCEQALKMAYDRKLWQYFARIVLPLQECRRQCRMIAVEGHIVLGTDHLGDDALMKVDILTRGCVVFTGKDAPVQAAHLLQRARQNLRHLLVMAATPGNPGSNHWTVHSASQPTLTVSFPAPPEAWQHQTLAPQQWPEVPAEVSRWPTPGDWVLDALEALGDQALKTVAPSADGVKRVDALLSALHAVSDHEILQQRLAEAASQMGH